MDGLIVRARTFEDELIALRRDLHRHPELSFREFRTGEVAATRVEELGWSVRRGVARTGVVADLENGPGPTIALRADMDALPIQESNETDYASTVPGVMHACGHDAHVAMLVGAARLLAEARAAGELPAGRVRLLFQPSEEAADEDHKSGAARMVEDGAMAGVDAVFGLHIGAHLPAGRAYLRSGPFMGGSDAFTAAIRGRSAHAARPHEGVDAIVLAAHAVLVCQTAVTRRVPPLAPAVLTIGRIAGGRAENVLADEVVLDGTLRYLDDDVRAALHGALRAALAATEAQGGETRLVFRAGYPPVVNDPAATRIAETAIRGALGDETVVHAEPVLLAEDFSILAKQAPGCFFWFGAALDPPREHHHPAFDIHEGALAGGATALAACALTALRGLAP